MTSLQKKRPIAAGDTRQGYDHSKNEDNFGIPVSSWVDTQNKGYLYIVADGVGGHAKGDVASKIAIEQIPTLYYSHPGSDIVNSLNYAIETTNQAIFHQSQQSEYYGMSSTIVIAVIRGAELFVANLGDSRAYLFSNNQLKQLTTDHAWVAEQVTRGVLTADEGANHPQRNVLTRALGTQLEANPDIRRYTLIQGDRLILCSDGVWGMIEGEFAYYLKATSTPPQTAKALVEQVVALKGADDATVIIITTAQKKINFFNVLSRPYLLIAGVSIALLLLLLTIGTTIKRQESDPETLTSKAIIISTPTTVIIYAKDSHLPSPVPTPTSKVVTDMLPTETATQTFCIARFLALNGEKLNPTGVVDDPSALTYKPTGLIYNGELLENAKPTEIRYGIANINGYTGDIFVNVKYKGKWVWILKSHLGVLNEKNECENYIYP